MIDWLAEDGRPVTMHGMRKTFETWAESSGRNPFVADAALQHGKAKRMGKVSGKYAKHEYHAERKAILAEWADYTMSPMKPQGCESDRVVGRSAAERAAEAARLSRLDGTQG